MRLEPDPIDRTHAESLAARDDIRRIVAHLRQTVASWEPRPLPKGPTHG